MSKPGEKPGRAGDIASERFSWSRYAQFDNR
ncbi:hypothetical protein SAMN06265360_1014 [Haloechinothrix alba]|uniref:Uncharacterized protein n=1 Tax=Haloechinothrix alba TaxID=664784 RepID=A0A238UXU3_9PSEU|nr:hypothetical protein SAMN06265360_1014 [Haloechinothrix alba]